MNPLYMVLLYTVIFSNITHNKLGEFSYSIFVAAGSLTWGLFTDILNRSQNVFLTFANIIKKLRFPHGCLSVIVVANAWISFIIAFGLFTGYLIISGNFPGWCYLAFIPILMIQTLFAVGLGSTLGIFNIFFRDIGQAVVVLLQIWFWVTPIVYVQETLPLNIQHLLAFNPLTPIIHTYQTILVRQQWPQWDDLIYPMIIAILCCFFCYKLHQKLLIEILDEL